MVAFTLFASAGFVVEIVSNNVRLNGQAERYQVIMQKFDEAAARSEQNARKIDENSKAIEALHKADDGAKHLKKTSATGLALGTSSKVSSQASFQWHNGKTIP